MSGKVRKIVKENGKGKCEGNSGGKRKGENVRGISKRNYVGKIKGYKYDVIK